MNTNIRIIKETFNLHIVITLQSLAVLYFKFKLNKITTVFCFLYILILWLLQCLRKKFKWIFPAVGILTKPLPRRACGSQGSLSQVPWDFCTLSCLKSVNSQNLLDKTTSQPAWLLQPHFFTKGKDNKYSIPPHRCWEEGETSSESLILQSSYILWIINSQIILTLELLQLSPPEIMFLLFLLLPYGTG